MENEWQSIAAGNKKAFQSNANCPLAEILGAMKIL